MEKNQEVLPYAHFKDVLSRCGIFLNDGGTTSVGVVICHEPSRSIRLLESALRLHSNRFTEFKDSMTKFFDTNFGILTSLNPMQSNFYNLNNSTALGQSDTLLKLLSRIQLLQDILVQILVGKMLHLACDISSKTDNDIASYNVELQILNHIRWCEVLYNPYHVINLLLEAVHVLPSCLQIEIISSLPGLSTDAITGKIIEELQLIAESTPGTQQLLNQNVLSYVININHYIYM
jgi:hypothetical protein